MSFNFATPKTATGFTLPTSINTTTPAANPQGFQFGATGDAKSHTPEKPASTLFSTPSTQSTGGFQLSSTPASTGFSLSTATTTPLFGSSLATTSAATQNATPQINFGGALATSTTMSTATAPSLFSTATTTTSSGFTLGSKLSTTASSTLATSATISSLVTPSTVTAVTSSATTTIPGGNLSYAQLEDAINKWSIDLEEQGKMFGNQAKQLNAWDRLLITNGEKVLALNNGIQRVKQQQQILDQELDFVLAQQKELEDLISPLEKELETINITDLDRNNTYQMAENMDSQFKQMSEDLKEIIEQLNEENKANKLANPINQIAKILNAHMSSLEWIDGNTTKISTQLDNITKLHDMNKKNQEFKLQCTYD